MCSIYVFMFTRNLLQFYYCESRHSYVQFVPRDVTVCDKSMHESWRGCYSLYFEMILSRSILVPFLHLINVHLTVFHDSGRCSLLVSWRIIRNQTKARLSLLTAGAMLQKKIHLLQQITNVNTFVVNRYERRMIFYVAHALAKKKREISRSNGGLEWACKTVERKP